MDVTVDIIVLVITKLVRAPHAPLDTIVQVGVIKHKNMPVQPAGILQHSVLPQHPRARAV